MNCNAIKNLSLFTVFSLHPTFQCSCFNCFPGTRTTLFPVRCFLRQSDVLLKYFMVLIFHLSVFFFFSVGSSFSSLSSSYSSPLSAKLTFQENVLLMINSHCLCSCETFMFIKSRGVATGGMAWVRTPTFLEDQLCLSKLRINRGEHNLLMFSSMT